MWPIAAASADTEEGDAGLDEAMGRVPPMPLKVKSAVKRFKKGQEPEDAEATIVNDDEDEECIVKPLDIVIHEKERTKLSVRADDSEARRLLITAWHVFMDRHHGHFKKGDSISGPNGIKVVSYLLADRATGTISGRMHCLTQFTRWSDRKSLDWPPAEDDLLS